MTKLYVTEYVRQAKIDGIPVQAGEEPAIGTHVVDYTAGAARSAANFNAQTRFVRVHTDAICSIKFGSATVTATTSDARMAAGSTEYFSCLPQQVAAGMRVSGITNT
jgi:hypothetical protein